MVKSMKTNVLRIEPMDLLNPDIIYCKDTYVMALSTGDLTPGGQIVVSRDLKEWKTASFLMNDTNEESVPMKSTMASPSIVFCDDTIYVAFTYEGGNQMNLFSAKDFYGPWNHSVIDGYFPNGSLFEDDGKKYIVWSENEVRLTEMNDDFSEAGPNGINDIILGQTLANCYGRVRMYKHKGSYLLFADSISLHSGQIEQIIAKSDSNRWNFVRDKSYTVVGKIKGYNKRSGIIQVTDEEGYVFINEYFGEVENKLTICPMKWKSGFPILKEYGIKSFEVSKDTSVINSDDDLICLNDFAADSIVCQDLATAWQWHNYRGRGCWQLKNFGELEISTNRLCDNPFLADNILTQRQFGPICATSVTIGFEEMKAGDVAGLMISCANSVLLGVKKEEDKATLVTVVGKATKKGGSLKNEIREIMTIDGNNVSVMIVNDFSKDKNIASFYYKENGKWQTWNTGWNILRIEEDCDNGIGTRIGLCISSYEKAGGKVSFSDFSMTEDPFKNVEKDRNELAIVSQRKTINYDSAKKVSKSLRKKYIRSDVRIGRINVGLLIVMLISIANVAFDVYLMFGVGLFFEMFIDLPAGAVLVFFAMLFPTIFAFIVYKKVTIPSKNGEEEAISGRYINCRKLYKKYKKFVALGQKCNDMSVLESEYNELKKYVLKSDEAKSIVVEDKCNNDIKFEVVTCSIASTMNRKSEQFIYDFMYGYMNNKS